jgi:hypothetical protein
MILIKYFLLVLFYLFFFLSLFLCFHIRRDYHSTSLFDCLTLLICIREIIGSNLAPDTGFYFPCFTSRPFYSRGKSPGTHWIGVCVDPRAGLDDVEKRKFFTLPGLELRPLGRPARSQSLTDCAIPATSACYIASLNKP